MTAIEHIAENLRQEIFQSLIRHTTLERHAAMSIAIRTAAAFTKDYEAEVTRLEQAPVF